MSIGRAVWDRPKVGIDILDQRSPIDSENVLVIGFVR